MSEGLRVVITVLFGWFGVHKFIDRKPLQGILYMISLGLLGFGNIIDIVSAIQLYKKASSDKIRNSRKNLGIIFVIILIISAIESISQGNPDMSFFLMIISAVIIFKVDVAEDELEISSTIQTTDKISDINQYNDKISVGNQNLKDNTKYESTTNYTNIGKNTKYLTGKFYNEEELILEKYKSLKTPNYIIIQINSQINSKEPIYFYNDMVSSSIKYKDKYLDHAEFYPFSSYYSKIRDLNKYQLNWYLYWRKEFLNGKALDTDLSYIFIFAYELICYTFNQNAAFNVSVLEKLYNSYKNIYPKLDMYLPDWINDMLSELGYFDNLNETEIEMREDQLVNALITANELDKISIRVWKEHYNARKSELTNKQISIISEDQKFNNKVKKYAGLLAKYYIDSNVDIIQRWFNIHIITEKKRLFNSVPSNLQRKEGAYKYRKYFSNPTFDNDMNQITKLCYDLLFPQKGIKETDYVISEFEKGRYELPEEFFTTYFQSKEDRNANKVMQNDKKQLNKEFNIDMNIVENLNTNISVVEKIKKKIEFTEDELEFLNKFQKNTFSKVEAQQYCIKKGKMLNAYITKLNEKYYSIINRELITINDENLILNLEMESIKL